MLDPTPDYAKRIKEFDARLADAKSNAIQTLLQKARSATSDAAETVVELSRLAERFRPFAEQQFSEVHSNIKVSVKNAAQLSANLDRLIQDPTIDAPIKKSLAFVTYQAIV